MGIGDRGQGLNNTGIVDEDLDRAELLPRRGGRFGDPGEHRAGGDLLPDLHRYLLHHPGDAGVGEVGRRGRAHAGGHR